MESTFTLRGKEGAIEASEAKLLLWDHTRDGSKVRICEACVDGSWRGHYFVAVDHRTRSRYMSKQEAVKLYCRIAESE